MKHDFTTHEVTSLYTHFGEHGKQGVHFHPCTRPDCNDVVLVGAGTSCAGKAAPHHFERWNEKTSKWERIEAEERKA